MAYETPNRWAHGDVDVSAANINKYTNSIIAIHAQIGEVATSIGTESRISNASFTVFHTRRWLYFTSTGTIDDPAGVGDSVSISEDPDTITAYDLDSVSWLTYGNLYTVSSVGWCQESDIAP